MSYLCLLFAQDHFFVLMVSRPPKPFLASLCMVDRQSVGWRWNLYGICESIAEPEQAGILDSMD